MNSMHLTRPQQSRRWIIMAVACFFFLWHLFIPYDGRGDDRLLFLEPFQKDAHGHYITFLMMRYKTWSARWLIEGVTVFLVNHVFLWRFLNACMMTIASCLPAYFFKPYQQVTVSDLMVSIGLFGLFPLTFFYETGWIATSTNYLWVYALGLIALYPVFRLAVFGEELSKSGYLLSTLGLIYASNQEQFLAILWASYLLMVLFFWQKRAQLWLWWSINLGILLIQTLIMIQSPGNYLRYRHEVAQWFPDFDQLSFLQKVSLGYTSSLKHLFFDGVWLVGILLLVLVITLYLSHATALYFFGWVPLVMFLSMAFSLGHTENNGFPRLLAAFNIYGTISTVSDLTTWYPDIILTLLYLFVGMVLLYQLPRKDQWIMLFLYLAVLCVRWIMGFSPTIWASATRTYLFSYGGIQLIILYKSSFYEVKFNTLGIPAVILSLGFIHWITAFGLFT